jgi:hypothetical protein
MTGLVVLNAGVRPTGAKTFGTPVVNDVTTSVMVPRKPEDDIH